MSSLLNKLADPHYTYRKGPECTVALAMRQMDKATLATCQAALDNAAAPSTQIAKALQELGFAVRYEALQRHRRGACRCGVA
jgi:methylmalonyl-CoA mutase cobalamin-binding subunit